MNIYVVYQVCFDGCNFWNTELGYFLHKSRAEYEVLSLEESDPCLDEYGNSYYWREETLNEEVI